jgi:ATP/maltotriose-dependent transcriptional regulator MalT/DNA-binding SARP family transcriptional activator
VPAEPAGGDNLDAETRCSRQRFPLRFGKIQRPALPAETLPRERLLNWLSSKADKRVVYVIAEAGFGKTTLVADYLRRSRLRTFWYRLDEEDTDGLAFLRYLVAACRAVDPSVFTRSNALLSDDSLESVGRTTVLETVISDVGSLGGTPSVLVLDDFYAAASGEAVCEVLERLIEALPAGVQTIVVSRRRPDLAVAALRAHGQLAELEREELRFEELETGRLFRDFYHQPLDPDVLHDLQERTDGWVASLQLVRTAVEGRSPRQIRNFVNSLSGAEGNLYDYLAEEVVGELDPTLRDFLVRTAILEDLEPETASIAASVTTKQARSLLLDAERFGLAARGAGARNTWRSHPLVREFLLSHLEAEIGDDGIAEMHRRLAAASESVSWRLAARHWAAAGDSADVRRVVAAATPTIVGTGDLAVAYQFMTTFPDPDPNPWFDIVHVRQMEAMGNYSEAHAGARRLADLIANDQPLDAKLASSVALAVLHIGFVLEDENLRSLALASLVNSEDREQAAIAEATRALYESTEEGSLTRLRALLLDAAQINRQQGHGRYEGISLLNLVNVELQSDDPEEAVRVGMEAIRILEACRHGPEVSGACINTAMGLARLGRWAEAQALTEVAVEPNQHVFPGLYGDAAEIEARYGDPKRARWLLEQGFQETKRAMGDTECRCAAARIALIEGLPNRADELLGRVLSNSVVPGLRSYLLSFGVQIAASVDPADQLLPGEIDKAMEFARRQQAWLPWKNATLTKALIGPATSLSEHLRTGGAADAALLSMQAELVVRRIGDLDEGALDLVRREAALRPMRWRWVLRRALDAGISNQCQLRRMCELLEIVGDADDLPRLRAVRKKKAMKMANAGRALAHRLAPRVYVEDLGKVEIRVGSKTIPGTEVRKKVLSLLCFLLSRPKFTATREQVLEALWPEMDPDAGANSLNQSAYFLRRIFEPATDDDDSAGYLRSRADLIWLDNELVGCRSQDCAGIIAAIRRDSDPELVTRLAETYSGPYAVDFIYDEWATSFRETLHASYLDRIERSIIGDTRAGQFERALNLAQLAMQADPDADQIELCLLRLYRQMGAQAAAAEQYTHYATVMREQMGIEPPPLESI